MFPAFIDKYGMCFPMQLVTGLLLYMTIILCDLTVTLLAYSPLNRQKRTLVTRWDIKVFLILRKWNRDQRSKKYTTKFEIKRSVEMLKYY